jgi:hypothetical protein
VTGPKHPASQHELSAVSATNETFIGLGIQKYKKSKNQKYSNQIQAKIKKIERKSRKFKSGPIKILFQAS